MPVSVFDRIVASLLLIGLFSSLVSASDWPSWRGPSQNGGVAEGDYPHDLRPEVAIWKAKLPGKGCSTPIVADRHIYLTAPVDGQDAALCFDWSGKEQWRTAYGPQEAGKHRNGSGCNASPVSDGEGLFVYFKSGTLAALELDGTKRWEINLVARFGPSKLFWDHGTSPVLTKNHLIFARMHNGESWLAAFDKQSGKIVWKVDRSYPTPVENDHGYTTPVVIEFQGDEALLVWGAERLTVHRAADGEVLWTCGGFNDKGTGLWPAIANPVLIDDMVTVAYGRNDKGAPLLFGVRLDGSGDVTKSSHVWKRDDISTFVPSPAVYAGRVYLVRDKGQVECLDHQTGKNYWSAKLPRGRAAYYASPLVASGKVYAAREDGVVHVGKVSSDNFELLSTNDMQEPVIGSPIAAGNRVFLRGEEHLFCFGEE